MKRQMICPAIDRLVEIEFDEDPENSAVLGVRSCTRYQPATMVDCDMACVHHMNAKLDVQVPLNRGELGRRPSRNWP